MGSLTVELCSEGLDSWGKAVGTTVFAITFGIATGKTTFAGGMATGCINQPLAAINQPKAVPSLIVPSLAIRRQADPSQPSVEALFKDYKGWKSC